MNVRYAAMLALLTCAAAAPLRAQVGYPPARSPYYDLEYRQEITVIGGYYWARPDRAGVAPRSAPLVGAHYEWRAGGPAWLTAEFARTWSQRTVLDPARPPSTRNLGDRDWPLYLADVGVGLSLTGERSWHDIVPSVKGGVGFVSDMHGAADVGGFKFGTRFALTWGAGVRYVTHGRWQLRADLNNRLHTVSYPNAYFTSTTTSGTPILTTGGKSSWHNDPALTLGLSYLFSR